MTEQTLTIQGLHFSAPMPYSEGHVLNAIEAKALNQTYGENLRNNFAPKVKKTLGEATEFTAEQVAALQAAFAEYAEAYEFAAKRAKRAGVDSITREALKIAKETIRAKMREQGKKESDYPEGTMDKLATQLIEAQPFYREEAKRRAEQIASATALGLGELGLTAE